MFPIGAFTLSGGLETFVQTERLISAEHLKQYVNNVISFMPFNELGFLFLVNKEGLTRDRIIELDQLYSAIRTPREIREGSERLCKRFLKAWGKVETLPSLKIYEQLIRDKECDGHYTIAVGLFIVDKGIPVRDGASIYAYSVVSAIITNAVKMVPLSQLDGQAILNQSIQKIDEVVAKAEGITEKELGVGGTGFEIYSYNHETLYSRLYMS